MQLFGAIVVRFKNGTIGTMMIDAITRAPTRLLQLMGTEGMLEWHWMQDLIRVYTAKDRTWREIKLTRGEREKGYVTTEDMYREEIGIFLKSIKGEIEYPYSFADFHKNLKVLFELEKSIV